MAAARPPGPGRPRRRASSAAPPRPCRGTRLPRAVDRRHLGGHAAVPIVRPAQKPVDVVAEGKDGVDDRRVVEGRPVCTFASAAQFRTPFRWFAAKCMNCRYDARWRHSSYGPASVVACELPALQKRAQCTQFAIFLRDTTNVLGCLATVRDEVDGIPPIALVRAACAARHFSVTYLSRYNPLLRFAQMIPITSITNFL